LATYKFVSIESITEGGHLPTRWRGGYYRNLAGPPTTGQGRLIAPLLVGFISWFSLTSWKLNGDDTIATNPPNNYSWIHCLDWLPHAPSPNPILSLIGGANVTARSVETLRTYSSTSLCMVWNANHPAAITYLLSADKCGQDMRFWILVEGPARQGASRHSLLPVPSPKSTAGEERGIAETGSTVYTSSCGAAAAGSEMGGRQVWSRQTLQKCTVALCLAYHFCLNTGTCIFDNMYILYVKNPFS